MKKSLNIPCPQCQGGKSRFFKEQKINCTYCRGSKDVNILEHFKIIGVTDERVKNVQSFIDDPRFVEYLESKSARM